MKEFVFEAKVLLKDVPTTLRFQAFNAVQARLYFESFGRIISDIRIVEEK